MIIFFGILSGLLLALSGIPQARLSIRQGHSHGVTTQLCLLVIGGIVCLAIYVYGTHGFDPILHSEHTITTTVWLIVLKYKLFPRV